MSRYMEELTELLKSVGTFRENVFDSQNGSDPEFAVFYDGEPRFVSERDMADADRESIERDDVAALEYIEEARRVDPLDYDAAQWSL